VIFLGKNLTNINKSLEKNNLYLRVYSFKLLYLKHRGFFAHLFSLKPKLKIIQKFSISTVLPKGGKIIIWIQSFEIEEKFPDAKIFCNELDKSCGIC
jgi:hypothetical protein